MQEPSKANLINSDPWHNDLKKAIFQKMKQNKKDVNNIL